LTAKKHGIYKQTFQCPTTTKHGWLLWSFQRIDITCLEKEIELAHNICLQLRYQNITLGQGTNSKDTVRALHIIANQKEADHVVSVIQKV
jgi:hypothetical protein